MGDFPTTQRTTCERCGTCCRKGGPTLHDQDIDLAGEGILAEKHLVTLRKGEPAFDNVQDRIITLKNELVRVRGHAKSRQCIFYSSTDKGCTIYPNRPLECRVLKCWDTEDLEKMYDRERVTRFAFVQRDSALGEIITAHEAACSYRNIRKVLQDLDKEQRESSVRELAGIINYDTSIRNQLRIKADVPGDVMDFLFGRPVERVLSLLGIKVMKDDQGNMTIYPTQNPRSQNSR